jgi:hypothetical protein
MIDRMIDRGWCQRRRNGGWELAVVVIGLSVAGRRGLSKLALSI